MTPTARTAVLVALAAIAAAAVGPAVAAVLVLGVIAAALADASVVRSAPRVSGEWPHILARGIPARMLVTADGEIRQASLPDVSIEPGQAVGELHATITARRRGRHVLPAPAVRRRGPLGIGAWLHNDAGEPHEVLVFPDFVTANRMALAVRRGRFRDPGQLTRGPLGLGTDFESIRDYVPDDDVRQVNWLATARLGRPMSNQYRVERDRDVICLIDTGRLMAAPVGRGTRLDATLDAAAAVCLVADAVGDRCGVLAFDASVHRQLRPRRNGGEAIVRAIFDLEPTSVDSDYELAFRRIGESRRAFVLLLTDLLEPSAARPLVEAIPVIARHHQVVIAGVTDPDLADIVEREPSAAIDVYATAVALDVLHARERAGRIIRSAGAEVLEAKPGALAAACVGAYVRAKALARV